MTGPNKFTRKRPVKSPYNPDDVRCAQCGSLYVRPRKRPPGAFVCNSCDNVFTLDTEPVYKIPRRKAQNGGSGVIAPAPYRTGYRWRLRPRTAVREA